MSTTHYPASQAQMRVEHSPVLRKYRAIITEYDWPNIDEHIDWVCTAPEAEIVDWAQRIQEDELSEAPEAA